MLEFVWLKPALTAALDWVYFEWALLGAAVIVGFLIGRVSKRKVKKTTVVIEKPRAQKPTDVPAFLERVKENRRAV